MYRLVEYKLDPDNLQSIALPQAFYANTPLILNGVYGNRSDNTAAISVDGFFKYISIETNTGIADLHFTIVGLINGKEITKAIAYPVNPDIFIIVDTLFDTIISITPNKNSVDNETIAFGTKIATDVNSVISTVPILIDSPYRKNTDFILQVTEFSNDSNNFEAVYDIYGSLFLPTENTGMSITELLQQGKLFPLTSTETPLTKGTPYYNISVPIRHIVVVVKFNAPIAGNPGIIIRLGQNN